MILLFQARNLEQKREWTLQLKRVILENYNAVIPSHARQLVMELGQNRTDGKYNNAVHTNLEFQTGIVNQFRNMWETCNYEQVD